MRRPECKCGEKGRYEVERDAYFCPVSGAWLEEPCDDAECRMCPGRPSSAPCKCPYPECRALLDPWEWSWEPCKATLTVKCPCCKQSIELTRSVTVRYGGEHHGKD